MTVAHRRCLTGRRRALSLQGAPGGSFRRQGSAGKDPWANVPTASDPASFRARSSGLPPSLSAVGSRECPPVRQRTPPHRNDCESNAHYPAAVVARANAAAISFGSLYPLSSAGSTGGQPTAEGTPGPGRSAKDVTLVRRSHVPSLTGCCCCGAQRRASAFTLTCSALPASRAGVGARPERPVHL